MGLELRRSLRSLPRDARTMEAFLHVHNGDPCPLSGAAQRENPLLIEPAGYSFAKVRPGSKKRIDGIRQECLPALVKASFCDGCHHFFKLDDRSLGHKKGYQPFGG